MVKKVNRILNTSIIGAILFMILGMFLILFPSISLTIISYVIAGILIIFGIILFIIDYKTYRLFESLFIYAILSSILGVLIILNPKSLIPFIATTLGVWFIINGLFKIRFSHFLRFENVFYYVISIIMMIISIICGFILILNPIRSIDLVTMSFGIVILIYSISDLIDVVIIKKYLNNIVKSIQNEYKKIFN